MSEPSPSDLLDAATHARLALQDGLDRDWTHPAGDLEWDCHRTLAHIGDALVFYSRHLATLADSRLPAPRHDVADLSPADLLAVMWSAAAILAQVARAAPPGARAFHPAGMADISGFMAMGCTEILVHTRDIARGLDLPFDPPVDLSARLVARLFPWVQARDDPRQELLWACGRVALPDRPRQDADWYWQCAPLHEWDGTIRRRTAPPAWR